MNGVCENSFSFNAFTVSFRYLRLYLIFNEEFFVTLCPTKKISPWELLLFALIDFFELQDAFEKEIQGFRSESGKSSLLDFEKERQRRKSLQKKLRRALSMIETTSADRERMKQVHLSSLFSFLYSLLFTCV